ncbi:MAG TPA: acetyl-CoA carboxylase biotin carboxylase subunit [Pseudogracilibacillus sp.]|nr:acetyl-CoA carboxylase biotin carboxylase subunit [Pseudogracilibacillus sp.]
MVQKVLIANRGAIASRIIRTCKKLGIYTVAIYSEADEYLPYVKKADEAVLIGPSPVQESYLNMSKIIEVAKEKQVEAIHPGYGFLSENSTFAKLCEEAGFVWIGPSSTTIEQMGNKLIARKSMEKAGVPIIPGTISPITNIEAALQHARKIGYPIMLKAASGGGGVGLQVIHSEEELNKMFERIKERAGQLFGNEQLFIEKLIENARHIEVQVASDHYGNFVHLYERECSIQRRNQKVIEEAPSPFLSEDTRTELCKAAIQAAKAINYNNIGTVEFLVDENEKFYFLEMNTRIQVEHGITEAITGIDLVQLQLEIADDKRIPFNQEEIKRKGHAIETRIYAEDPKNFLPSPGTITNYIEPEKDAIRIESSVEQGSKVTPFYDPMICKLIAYGKSRTETIDILTEGLNNFVIDGIKTNIPMLQTVLTEENFLRGNTPIDYVNKYYLNN